MQSRIDKLCEKMHDNEAVFISSYPNIFYYSGFTSEDAYLLISHSGKYIITDSRYTIQAREQGGSRQYDGCRMGKARLSLEADRIRF